MYYKKCIVVVYDVQYFYCHNIFRATNQKNMQVFGRRVEGESL